MAAVEMLEIGSFKAGPASRCAVCPARGLCAPCRPQTVKGESGSGGVLVFKNIKGLLSLPELPRGMIYFNSPAREGSGEPPRTSGKTCPECKESASTCRHSETSKR